MRRKCIWWGAVCTIVGFLLVTQGIAKAEGLIVIANKSVTASSLTPEEIKMIYLGKKKMWDNKMKIIATTLDSGTTSDLFLKEYVKKSPVRFKTYWKKQIFTGGGKPPRSFENEKELVKFVGETKGAVGYIAQQSYSENVKILCGAQ